MTIPDNQAKPRTHGQHLTSDEIEKLRQSFRGGSKPADAAREVNCSSRIACKYFRMFRSQGLSPSSRPFNPAKDESRFYKSNFVPT